MPTEDAKMYFNKSWQFAIDASGKTKSLPDGEYEISACLAGISKGLIALATASHAIYLKLDQVEAKLDALAAQQTPGPAGLAAAPLKGRRSSLLTAK